MVTIAEFAVNEYGVSTSTAGLVSSIFIIGSLIGRFTTGPIIVKIGSKRTFYIGLIAFLITTLLYFASVNLGTLIVFRLLHGIALGVIGTSLGTIVAQIVPESRRGEGIGYFSLSNTIATAIGPFLGILLTNLSDDFRIIFIFNAALVVLCTLTGLLLRMPNIVKPVQPAKQAAPGRNGGFSFAKFLEYKALPISFIALLAGFVYSGVMSFLTFYIKEINLVSVGSFFFLVYALFILISRPVTGPLMDRKGANIVVYPAMVLFIVGMLVFSQTASAWTFLLAAALIGLGYGNFTSIAQTLSLKGVKPQRYGLATSTYYIFYDLGLGVGPYLLGFVVPHSGYRNLYLFMVPVIVIATLLYFVLVGRKQRSYVVQE